MKNILAIVICLCLHITFLICQARGDIKIEGFSDKITKRIGNAELVVNNAGEISLTLNGKSLVKKDHAAFVHKDKFLYSSEWTKEPPEITINDGEQKYEVILSLKKAEIGEYRKVIILTADSLSSKVTFNPIGNQPEVKYSYSFVLNGDIEGISAFTVNKNGIKSQGSLKDVMQWDIASAMSEVAFPKVDKNGLTLKFNTLVEAATPWHFNNLRKHSQENVRGINFNAGSTFDNSGEPREMSILLSWDSKKNGL